jgi:uncharacterized protein involved in exopolysaccharide biosynthesis
VTPDSIDDYLRRLAEELRVHGHMAARLLDEAREHLADAVEDGVRRGLAREDAERDAFRRFGAPELIAHSVSERDSVMIRLVSAFETAWQRRWWILAPTVATALVTSVATHYFLPTVYRSESIVQVVAPRVDLQSTDVSAQARAQQRIQTISQTILSPSRLEWVAKDFGLDKATQTDAPLTDAVLRMRRNISFELTGDGFALSFEAPDPTLAMKVTERLTSLFVEENLRDRERQVTSTSQFLDAQLADVRKRLVEAESNLERQRSLNSNRQPSRADALPYEVLQERYKDLLIRSEDARAADALARRASGEQFRIMAAARLPQRPVGPSRLGLNLAGALTGLGLGLALVVVRGRSTTSHDRRS